MIDPSAFISAQNDPAFGDEGWLTFYLCGSFDQHKSMKVGLVALNAINLSGAEYGFVYAKVPTRLSEAEIRSLIEQVHGLATEAGVEIDVIDLDASADVAQSKFYTIWQAPPA
ncbi:hypothetical protein [Erythrobacter sp.]|uniref:hypothetical protein n=1 Tax=Erythrobacter sp. TaxID=1042 RepID=UPI0025E6842D|nr:hypothetical protein [Erythrobacter sp.]